MEKSLVSKMFQLLVIISTALVSSAFGAAIPKGLVPLLDGRIVGGQSTTIEEFPHQISMRFFGSHRCGGSIVDKDTIITAAHCVDGITGEYVTIRAGTTNQQKEGVDRKISAIYMHEGYSRNTMNNDIAIMILDSPLKFSPSIRAVQLPRRNEVINPGSPVFVSGWGVLQESGTASNILQFVEVSVVDHHKCFEAYGNMITETMLCAGYQNGGRDACQGDSGGPLITFDENHSAKLVGVVSWGYGCARPRIPGVYTNVSALLDWLDNKFEEAKKKKDH